MDSRMFKSVQSVDEIVLKMAAKRLFDIDLSLNNLTDTLIEIKNGYDRREEIRTIRNWSCLMSFSCCALGCIPTPNVLSLLGCVAAMLGVGSQNEIMRFPIRPQEEQNFFLKVKEYFKAREQEAAAKPRIASAPELKFSASH